MKKIITSILLMLFMGCSNNVTSVLISECLECSGDYHFDENGFCVCD